MKKTLSILLSAIITLGAYTGLGATKAYAAPKIVNPMLPGNPGPVHPMLPGNPEPKIVTPMLEWKELEGEIVSIYPSYYGKMTVEILKDSSSYSTTLVNIPYEAKISGSWSDIKVGAVVKVVYEKNSISPNGQLVAESIQYLYDAYEETSITYVGTIVSVKKDYNKNDSGSVTIYDYDTMSNYLFYFDNSTDISIKPADFVKGMEVQIIASTEVSASLPPQSQAYGIYYA